MMNAGTKNIENAATYTVNPSSDPFYVCYSIPTAVSDCTITLPSNASAYDGLNMKFFSAFKTRSSGSTKLYCSNYIYYNDSQGHLAGAQSLWLQSNEFVDVISMDGKWHVTTKNVSP
jgi:hypothetical protein